MAVVFLLDMSASTAEAVEEGTREGDWNVPGDPVAYTAWLRARRGETSRRPYKRIIDVEKESMVLLMMALENIGDRYGVYGFSGFGRENVEFYVIKEVEERLTDRVKRRLDKVAPLHATRMGPAIRTRRPSLISWTPRRSSCSSSATDGPRTAGTAARAWRRSTPSRTRAWRC